MWKKIVINISFLILTLLVLSGCSNGWEKSVQVSSLKYEDNYIKGRMKNLTNNAYDVTIIFKVKSGSLTEDKYCYELLRPNDTIDLECLAYGIDDTYKIEIEDVKYEKHEIPVLEKGSIDVDALKYHFQDIYKEHSYNFISFTNDVDFDNFPYIKEIVYKDDEIGIISKIKKDENIVSFSEVFDLNNNNKIKLFLVLLSSEDEDFISKVITKISLMHSISSAVTESLSIASTLNRKDIIDGYCIEVGNWCINTNYTGEYKKFTFYRN